uniref:Uncharacterized protein n=1 Tax=Lepeophtheirus salmonis TaxID=72036 RepID=A0A0K2T8U9_LEPSM
MCAMGNIYKNS